MEMSRDNFNQDKEKNIRRPSISVLVPVYNVDPYLEQCLDSLVKQSFKDIEIICVNDGSTDQSGMILDRYVVSDSRMRVIHKKNTGYGNTMNTALNLAKGDYVAILESDDFAEPDMLERLYREAEKQKADVIKGNHYDFEDGRDTFFDRIKSYPKDKLMNCTGCPELLNLADTIWSCLYRRDFLLKHRICFHETLGASYQDISFALQVWLHAERVYFIEDALLHYRKDNPSSSMNDPSKLFCVFDEYEWAGEKLREILDRNSVLYQYFTASKYRDYLNHYYRVGVQYQYTLLMRIEESFCMDRQRGVLEDVFIPEVWKQLREIETDRDVFFRRTAKSAPDTRLSVCHFENEKIYIDTLCSCLKMYQKIFIYGAGQVGKRFAKWLLEHGGRIDAFLVTSVTDEQTHCMGIPVMAVQEAAYLSDICAVMIAVTEKTQYEIYETLKRYDFCHIFRIDTVIRKII